MSKASKHNVAKINPASKDPQTRQTGMSPFHDMQNYFNELEKSFFGGHMLRPSLWPLQESAMQAFTVHSPKVDVIDRDTEILVKAEMPGVDKKDVDISITDRTLTLRAQHSKEEKEEKENYYRREISRGSFSRSVMLPETVDIEKAKASFKDGILEISLPKTEPSRRRNIEVS